MKLDLLAYYAALLAIKQRQLQDTVMLEVDRGNVRPPGFYAHLLDDIYSIEAKINELKEERNADQASS